MREELRTNLDSTAAVERAVSFHRVRVCISRASCNVLRTFIAMLTLASLSASAQTTQASARDLLAAAAASAPWSMHYASVTDVRYRATFGTAANQSSVGTDSVVRKYRDRERLHITIDYIDYLTSTGELVTRATRREIVSDPKQRVGWWFPFDKPLSGTAQLAKSTKQIEAMKLIDESDPATGCCLDGYVDGAGNIVALMNADIVSSSAATQVHEENWNGISCEVVQSQTPNRRIVIWIAPASRNIAVKYVLESNDPDTGPTTAEFEATAFHNIDGYIAVSAGRSTRTWMVASDRTKWRETVQATRTALNLHPDFDEPNLFTTRGVPSGIRVFFDDLPDVGIDFVWNNGAPMAKVDADLFSELGTSLQRTSAGEIAKTSPASEAAFDAASFGGESRRMSQLWLVLLGSAAISAIALIAIYLGRRTLRASR